MVRWVFASFVFACVLCFIQAFPQSGSGPTESTTMSSVETAINDVMNSLQKGLQGIMEDPGINKLVQDGQKLLQNAASTIQTEAAKIVPRTD